MPAERPSFCEKVNCPVFAIKGRCILNDYVGTNWSSPTGRKRERLRLSFQAETETGPQEIVNQCQEKGFNY
ncbi:MAG: hypothetical protein AAB874_07695 [Patescibacteria group bacterium]